MAEGFSPYVKEGVMKKSSPGRRFNFDRFIILVLSLAICSYFIAFYVYLIFGVQ